MMHFNIMNEKQTSFDVCTHNNISVYS